MIFTVDKENKTVIARYRKSDNKGYWDDVLLNTLINVDADGLFTSYELFEIVKKVTDSRDVFYGKAKCHPEDMFSEHEGKRLAIIDLNNRFNNAKRHALNLLGKKLDLAYNDAKDRMFKRW